MGKKLEGVLQIIQTCRVAQFHPNYSISVTLMALQLTQEHFGVQRSTQWLQGVQLLWSQNKPKSSPLHHHAWQLVWGVCANHFFWVSPNVLLCITTKHLHLDRICLEDIVFGFFSSFSGHCRVRPWGKLSETSSPWKKGTCLECFPLANNLSQRRMVDSKLFGNDLIWMAATAASLRLLQMSFLLGIVLTHSSWRLQTSKLTKLLVL